MGPMRGGCLRIVFKCFQANWLKLESEIIVAWKRNIIIQTITFHNKS